MEAAVRPVQVRLPDNPRALIANANRYEPELNRATAEFAAHYGTVILPARPRKPQDKAKDNPDLAVGKWRCRT